MKGTGVRLCLELSEGPPLPVLRRGLRGRTDILLFRFRDNPTGHRETHPVEFNVPGLIPPPLRRSALGVLILWTRRSCDGRIQAERARGVGYQVSPDPDHGVSVQSDAWVGGGAGPRFDPPDLPGAGGEHHPRGGIAGSHPHAGGGATAVGAGKAGAVHQGKVIAAVAGGVSASAQAVLGATVHLVNLARGGIGCDFRACGGVLAGQRLADITSHGSGCHSRIPIERRAGLTAAWKFPGDHGSPCHYNGPSGCPTLVPVVETVHLRNRHDAPSVGGLHRPCFRSILIQREIGPGFMILRQEQSDPPT